MAGARIPDFTSVPAVSPARDPGLSVDASAFGYQTGAALVDLGGVVKQVAAERQDRANATWLMETVAKTRRAIGEKSRAAETAAEPGAPDFAKSLMGQIDPLIETALANAPSERAREAAFERLSAMRESTADSASSFESTERAIHGRTKVAETVDILAATLLQSPGDHDAVMQEIDAALDALPPREAEALRPEARYQGAANYLTARIEEDPVAAREEILSGSLASDLAGKDADWLKNADAEIARREAQAKADEAEAGRLAKAEAAEKRASVQASWSDWETEVKVKGVIPQGAEAQIRDAFADDPERGESLIGELKSEQEFFPKRKQAGQQSFAEQQATADAMFQDIGGPGAAQEADQAARYAQAVTEDRKGYSGEHPDPALSVLQNSPELQAAWAAAANGDPAATAKAVAMSDQLQVAKGLAPWQARIFSDGAAATEVGAFAFMSAMPGDPTAKALDRQTGALAAAAHIDQLAAQYGPNWPRALDELVAAGLPKEAQVLASFSGPGKNALFRADLVTAMDIGEAQLEKAAGSNAAKVNDAVNAELAEFMDTFGNSPDAVLPYRNAVYMVALLAAKGTGDPAEAATKAAEALQSLYATVPDDRGGAGYRIPAPSLNDPAAIKAGTDAAIEALPTMDVSPYGSSDPVIQGEAGYVASQYADAVARDHHWITAPGENGLLLLGPDYQPVMRGDQPVFFTWDELRDYGDAGAPPAISTDIMAPQDERGRLLGDPVDPAGTSGTGRLGGDAGGDRLTGKANQWIESLQSADIEGASKLYGLFELFDPTHTFKADLMAGKPRLSKNLEDKRDEINRLKVQQFLVGTYRDTAGNHRTLDGLAWDQVKALWKDLWGQDLTEAEQSLLKGISPYGGGSFGTFKDSAPREPNNLIRGGDSGKLTGMAVRGSAAADDLTADVLAGLGYLKAGPDVVLSGTIAAMQYGKDERGPPLRPGMDSRVLDHLPPLPGYRWDASGPAPRETLADGFSYIRDNAPPPRPGPKVTLAMPPARPALAGALGLAGDIPGVKPEVPVRAASNGALAAAKTPEAKQELDWRRKEYGKWLSDAPDAAIVTMLASMEKGLPAVGGMVMPVASGEVRNDPWGTGGFHSRAGGAHQGVDILAEPGELVYAPESGTVTNLGYAYPGDTTYRYVEIMTADNRNIRLFYVLPAAFEGQKVTAGITVIGAMQDVALKHTPKLAAIGGGMRTHIHFEVRENGRAKSRTGTLVDPWPMLQAGQDVAMAMLEAEGVRRGIIQVASR